jgi:hypothetical protein
MFTRVLRGLQSVCALGLLTIALCADSKVDQDVKNIIHAIAKNKYGDVIKILQKQERLVNPYITTILFLDDEQRIKNITEDLSGKTRDMFEQLVGRKKDNLYTLLQDLIFQKDYIKNIGTYIVLFAQKIAENPDLLFDKESKLSVLDTLFLRYNSVGKQTQDGDRIREGTIIAINKIIQELNKKNKQDEIKKALNILRTDHNAKDMISEITLPQSFKVSSQEDIGDKTEEGRTTDKADKSTELSDVGYTQIDLDDKDETEESIVTKEPQAQQKTQGQKKPSKKVGTYVYYSQEINKIKNRFAKQIDRLVKDHMAGTIDDKNLQVKSKKAREKARRAIKELEPLKKETRPGQRKKVGTFVVHVDRKNKIEKTYGNKMKKALKGNKSQEYVDNLKKEKAQKLSYIPYYKL